MVFSKKLNKNFHNPAVMRDHERNADAPKPREAFEKVRKGAGHTNGEDHGGVVGTEVHSPDSPNNPSPGNHHVVVHHADGHEEHSDHASAEEAQRHAEEAGGDGGEEKSGLMDDQDGDDEAGVCPECGGAMVDGRCQECGYEDSGSEMSGAGEEGGGCDEY